MENNDLDNTPTVLLDSELDERKINVLHTIEAQFAQSRELRDEVKRSVRLKIRAQHDLLKQKIGTELDLEKKVIFDDYLSRVAALEKQFVKKIDQLDRENDEYESEVRDNYYQFFDEARAGIKKWESKPDRYQAELDRLNKQEQKRLSNVQSRLEKVESKRENILNQTLEIFDSEYGFEAVKQKFDIFN